MPESAVDVTDRLKNASVADSVSVGHAAAARTVGCGHAYVLQAVAPMVTRAINILTIPSSAFRVLEACRMSLTIMMTMMMKISR